MHIITGKLYKAIYILIISMITVNIIFWDNKYFNVLYKRNNLTATEKQMHSVATIRPDSRHIHHVHNLKMILHSL